METLKAEESAATPEIDPDAWLEHIRDQMSDLEAERLTAIRYARGHGRTLRAIGEHVGLSHSHVANLARTGQGR